MSTSRRSKKDIDRFVGQLGDDEKCTRGYQIAVLYSEIGEYESAKRYLTSYLSSKENLPQAHKLMGQICEGLKELDQAIECYKKSLELDNKQKNLVIKICELLRSLPNQDQNRLKYWAERGEKLYPNNPVIFELQEKILMCGWHENADKIEDLYAKQLEKNYLDMSLHIKLLELYTNTERVKDAVKHAMEVERTLAFVNSIDWYRCLTRIYKMYRMKEQGSEDFHLHRLFALRNLVILQIPQSDIITSASSLFQFDQCLWEAMRLPSQKPKWRCIVTEMEGQLYFLLALLLLKRAQKGQISWKDSSSFAIVCLLLSNHQASVDSRSSWFHQIDQTYKKFFNRLVKIGSYRHSQGGYMLASMMRKDSTSRLQHVRQQLRTSQARDKLYDVVFTLREMRESKDRSYLMKSDLYLKASLVPPAKTAIADFDSDVYALCGENLHELVWMAVQKYSVKDNTQPVYGFTFGEKLPFAAQNLTTGTPESMSQLDIQAFFYSVVRCSAISYEEQNKSQRQDPYKPVFLPACICAQLCTKQQSDWWDAMYKFTVTGSKENFAKMKLTIQRGLETVRVVGAHGMSVGMVTHLAKTFDARALDMRQEGDEFMTHTEALERRAALYWKEATRLLSRLEKNMPLRYPKERLFVDGNQVDINDNDIKELTEQATFSLAVLNMREGKYEEAVEKFQASKKPMASFYLAQIYRDMADNIPSDDPDANNQKVALLEKSLDTLYKTLDMLQDDKHNELNRIIPASVDDVVNQLERLRMAGMSLTDSICVSQLEDDDDDSPDGTPSFSTPQGQNKHEDSSERVLSMERMSLFTASPREAPSFRTSKIIEQSTPAPRRLSSEARSYSRPSPERLDARIWALEKKLQTVLDLQQGTKDQTRDLISSLNSQVERSMQTVMTLQDTVREQSNSRHTEQRDIAQQNYELRQTFREMQGQYVELAKDMKEMKECIMNLRGTAAGRYMMPPMATPFRPPAYGYPPQQQSWIPGANYGYQVPPIPGAPVSAYPGAMGSLPRMASHNQPGMTEHLSHQNDIVEDDIYHIDGEYYEDDGSQPPPNVYNVTDTQLQQDWPFGHRAGLEGKSTITYSPQGQGQVTAPQTGLFAQALRGQSIQYAYKQAASQGVVIPRGQSPQLIPQQQAQGLPGPGFFSALQAFPGQENAQVIGQASPLAAGSSPVQGSPLMEALTKTSSAPGAVTMTTVSMPPNAVAGPSIQARPNLVQGSKASSGSSDTTFSISQSVPSQSFNKAPTTLATGSNMPLFRSLVAAAKSPDKSNVDTEINVTIHPVTSDSSCPSSENFGGLTYTIDSIKTIPKSGSAPSFADMAESSAGTNIFKMQTGTSGFTMKSPAKLSPVKSPGKDEDDDNVEEYEPKVDFKPVVELPDLVEVKTGEEDEDRLFGERAKLFRFDMEAKQWKERGIGEMKILKHKVTHRTRILMRREQVLKLCANHYLAAGMKLTPMSGMDKGWCWTAMDFSQEELQTERLAVKFKTKDQAEQFKEVFEECLAELENNTDDKEVTLKPKTPEKSDVPVLPRLSEMFKLAPGQWTCTTCMIRNDSNVNTCAACSALKPGSKPDDNKSTAVPSSGGFQFGVPAAGGFKFGVQPTSTVDKKNEPPVTEKEDSNKPRLSELFKPKPGDWSCTECLVSNPVTEVKCLACSTPKPGAKSVDTTAMSAPSTGGFKFGNAPTSSGTGSKPFDSTATSATGGFTFGNAPTSTGSSGSGFSFVMPTPTTSSTVTTTVAESKPSGFVFGTVGTKNDTKGASISKDTDKVISPASSEAVSMTTTTSSASSDKGNAGFTFGSTGNQSFVFGKGTTKDTASQPSFVFVKNAAATTTTDAKTTSFTFGKTSTAATTDTTTTKESFTFGTENKSTNETTTATTSAAKFTFSLTADKKPEGSSASGFQFNFDKTATPVSGDSKAEGGKISPAKFTFTPTPVASKPVAQSPKSPETDADGRYINKEGEDDHLHFEPVIKLPDTVEVVTGEEDDDVLFEHRAKLYRLHDKQWKERGIGNVKILCHRENGKCRLLMRREQVLKICCHHYITDSLTMQIMPNSQGRALIWYAMDFSNNEEEPVREQFSIRFKTADIAEKFKEKFEEAQKKSKKESLKGAEGGEDTPKVVSSATPKVVSIATPSSSRPKQEKSEVNDNDVIFVKEEKATPKQVELARRYFLPDNFYLYEKKPPCPGCRGCEDRETDTSSSAAGLKESPVTSKAKPVAQPVSLFGSGSAAVKPGGIFGAGSAVVKPEGGIFGAGSAVVKPEGGIFGAGSAVVKPEGGIFGAGSAVDKPEGGIFGDVSSTDTESATGGQSKSVISQPSEAFGASSSSSIETTDGAQGRSDFFGGTNSSFSFASLAAQANDDGKAFQKDTNKPFSWTGAGQQLFGAGGDGEADEDNDEVVQGNDPHFEPVIPLPELVKTVTGEEGMTVLFNVRAKLFRFDPDSKQWKEKGIGEMKILKDTTSGKVRLLLRREQVLKLACNHWLTPDINVKPLATSETSWCWTAQDFCEGEPKTEQFAVRFKNTDLAAQFKEIVDSCQKELREKSSSREDKVPIQVSEVSSNVNVAASGDACSARKDEVESTSQTVEGSSEAKTENKDDDDDDDEYEDVEEEVQFEKRLTLFVKDGDKWKSLGVGQLKITLDDDVNGHRVTMETDTQQIVCSHIIVQESVLQINKKKRYCEWSPLDFSTDEPVRRDFRAQFSSEAAAEEFQKVFEQGKLLARDSDISERDMVTTFPREIDVPEVHSHNAAED